MSSELVLIVEDSPMQQQMLCSLARRAGVEPLAVASGQEAIDARRAINDFLVVFMDVRLAGMDGLECTRKLRQLEEEGLKRVPIVAITAQSEDETKRKCIEAGMDDFLQKPFSFDDMDQLIQRFIEQKDRLANQPAG